MPDIDVPAITDKLATAMATATYTAPSLGRDYLALVAAVDILPVIAEALYAPILALHTVRLVTERTPTGVTLRNWKACSCGVPTHSACPTVRTVEAALDAIRGQA